MDLLNFAKGLKTFAGGLILIGGGAAGVAFGVVDAGTAIQLVGNGLGLWGLGGKASDISKGIEKWTESKQKEITINVPKHD